VQDNRDSSQVLEARLVPEPSASIEAVRAQDQKQVTISVYNHADISTQFLVKAEEEARRIFRRAGLTTVWLNCPPDSGATKPAGCSKVDINHLAVNVVPKATEARLGRTDGDVLGAALLNEKGVGYYAYAFLEPVHRRAESRGLGSALLANVFAHEVGHLLLGSGTHSANGIMCADWEDSELLEISRGAMSFSPSESKTMRDRLALEFAKRNSGDGN
jgi:hypothetical protein